MVIRFLQTTPSEHPEYPFMAGQIITVAQPTPFLLSLLDGVRAEVVRVDEQERAVLDAGTVPEPVRAHAPSLLTTGEVVLTAAQMRKRKRKGAK